jgi:RimJ/RimL family protein N-acetyltransferase
MHPPIILNNPNLPRLFCKPEHPKEFVHYSDFVHLNQLISFWSLDIDKHLPFIHQWVNMAYTSSFWQMDGAFEPFKEVYEKILNHPNTHSFVGYYGDQLVCQLDVYMVGVDELSYIIPEESEHCGFHLLMAPNNNAIHGLTSALIKSFLQYYFSFEQAKKMYAEPDVRNERSIKLLRGQSFVYLSQVALSYKTASLYCLTRSRFNLPRPAGTPREGDSLTLLSLSTSSSYPSP